MDIRWLFLSLRGKERDLREVGTLAVSHTASGGRRTGALDFVATENLSVQLGGKGWVESHYLELVGLLPKSQCPVLFRV